LALCITVGCWFLAPGVGDDVGLRRVITPIASHRLKLMALTLPCSWRGRLRRGGSRGARASGTGDIRHHHQHAARFVEDNTVEVLIHGLVL
jgi:hypothetical protein